MIEKLGHIKNPLSIIAIFAGIAEISGTVVLPFITPENQGRYVGFLIWFPTLLVLAFFFTLLTKHRFLYAPSDFRSDEAFAKFGPATVGEVRTKKEQEILEDNALPPAKTELRNGQQEDLPLNSPTQPAKRSELSVETPIMVSDEDLIFDELGHLLISLKRNVVLTGENGSSVVIDGVAKSGDTIVLIEVKVEKRTASEERAITVARNFMERVRRSGYSLFDQTRFIVAIGYYKTSTAIDNRVLFVLGKEVEIRYFDLRYLRINSINN